MSAGAGNVMRGPGEPVEVKAGQSLITLVPHHIDNVGARVLVTIGAHTLNADPDDLRHLAAMMRIAADEAEALAKRKRRQTDGH